MNSTQNNYTIVGKCNYYEGSKQRQIQFERIASRAYTIRARIFSLDEQGVQEKEISAISGEKITIFGDNFFDLFRGVNMVFICQYRSLQRYYLVNHRKLPHL